MAQKVNISQELNELNSSLYGKPVQEAYTVPAGYFEGLAGAVMARIRALEAADAADELAHLSPYLSRLSRNMPYTVPAGYFDTLTDNISAHTRPAGESVETELRELSPLLSGLKKDMPYRVPAGYFEQAVPLPATKQPVARVISITGRKWFRYAAAAMLTGVIVLAGLMVFKAKNAEAGGVALAHFKKDIKKLDAVQQEDLIDFIDAGLNLDETAQASVSNTAEIRELLKDIPDDELIDFNEQTEDAGSVLMVN